MKDYDSVQVEDGDGFTITSDMGIKEIALDQFRRCCVEGSKEMVRGGLATKLIKGSTVQIEIPNQRAIFINSVTMLEIVLRPEINKNKEIVEALRKIEEDIGDADKEQSKKEGALQEEYQKRMNNKHEKINWSSHMRGMNDNWDMQLVKYHQEKLISLSILLHDLNYFSEMSASGG